VEQKLFESAGGQIALSLPSDWVQEPNESGVMIYPPDRDGCTLFVDVLTFSRPPDSPPRQEPGFISHPAGGWWKESVTTERDDGVDIRVTSWDMMFDLPGYKVVVPCISWVVEEVYATELPYMQALNTVRQAIENLQLR
jgi:hypothetical protein